MLLFTFPLLTVGEPPIISLLLQVLALLLFRVGEISVLIFPKLLMCLLPMSTTTCKLPLSLLILLRAALPLCTVVITLFCINTVTYGWHV